MKGVLLSRGEVAGVEECEGMKGMKGVLLRRGGVAGDEDGTVKKRE